MTNFEQQNTPRMRTGELMRRTAIVTLTVLAILGLVLVVNQLRTILLWILIAVVLAIALQPAVTFLTKHRLPRTAAALLVSFVAVLFIAGVIVAVVVPVAVQGDNFIREFPHIVTTLFAKGGSLHFVEQRLHLLERLAALTPDHVVKILVGNQQKIIGVLSRAASVTAALISVITIMVMLLMQGPRAWLAILDSMVGEERVWAERIGEDFLHAVGGYLRGNIAISLVAGTAAYIVLRILGISYAETLAVIVAVLDIIPLVGATIAMVIVSAVGLAVGGTTDGIILLVFFIAYQQFENNVLQNIVYSKTVSLSPLVVFIAALVGAALGGIVGVLLAIPLASAGWTLGKDLIALRRARYTAEQEMAERSTTTVGAAEIAMPLHQSTTSQTSRTEKTKGGETDDAPPAPPQG